MSNNYSIGYLLLCLAIHISARIYNITFPSLGTPNGGSPDTFKGRLENASSVQTEVFEFTGNCLTDNNYPPCYFLMDLMDIGSNLTYLYMMSQGDDDLAVDEIVVVDVSTGQRYFIDEFLVTWFSYGNIVSNPNGCEVLTASLQNNDITTQPQEPTCITFPPTSQPTTAPTATDSDPYRIYSIEVEIFSQGGSTDDIFAGIEGVDGNMTEFVNISSLSDAGFSGKTYSFDLNLSNVGVGAKLYLLNYGVDSLLIEGCTIDGVAFSETTYDILEYDGADPRGCHSVVCDVISGSMAKSEHIPCLNYESPFNINSNETRTYRVVIDLFLEGGSVDDIYVIIQSLSGRMSDPYNIGAMPEGDRLYPFDITMLDMGDPKAIYLVKLSSDGNDALLVDGCSVDSIYSAEELTGDLLEYGGNDPRGCGYVKCDFLHNEMSKGEQDICDLIPVFISIGNGTNAQYFISIDTTNIPFSVPGGSSNDIWLRVVNNDNAKSEYVFLGNGMSDDGEVYTFRADIKNLGADIRYLQFIQFGEDDLCIDYCQINEQFVDLGMFGSECNENNILDNDGCAVMTCDFELNQITAIIESPCKQDIYGWNNKTYRIYTIIINVCPDGGDLIDTKSVNPFWIYLENVEDGLLSNSSKISSIGSDGENIFQINTTNVGEPDKLYLVHYNNDDLCVMGISVDGFEVDAGLIPGFIWDEYDCEYPDDGCNVITADFETNEMDSETQSECQFTPRDLDAENDKCLLEQVDEWADELFDFASLVGIISGIVLIVLILSICTCIVCCAYHKFSAKSGDHASFPSGGTSVEMR